MSELKQLGESLGKIKATEFFRPLWAAVEPQTEISNLIIDANLQCHLESHRPSAIASSTELYSALMGYRAAMEHQNKRVAELEAEIEEWKRAYRTAYRALGGNTRPISLTCQECGKKVRCYHQDANTPTGCKTCADHQGNIKANNELERPLPKQSVPQMRCPSSRSSTGRSHWP